MSKSKNYSFLLGFIITGLVCVFSILFVFDYGVYGAYVTLNDIVIIAVAYLTLDSRYFVSVSLGALLGTIILDVPQYALATVVIKLLEYLILVYLFKKIKNPILNKVIPMISAVIIITVGFTLADWLVIGQLEHVVLSILYNSFEVVVSAIIVLMFIPLFDYLKSILPRKLEVTE